MDKTKKFLQFAVAFGIIMLSLSAFIYSIRDSRAIAAPLPDMGKDGYVIVGCGQLSNSDWYIVGYHPESRDIKMLARQKKISQ